MILRLVSPDVGWDDVIFIHSYMAGCAGEPLRGAKLQDILRLLTLWFNHGNSPDVEAALKKGFGHVSIDTWLVVIPQVPHSCPNCLLLLQLQSPNRMTHPKDVRTA